MAIDPKYGIDPETCHYLGDGLYATNDGVQVIVFAYNGRSIYNIVYMEPWIFEAFKAYGNKFFRTGQASTEPAPPPIDLKERQWNKVIATEQKRLEDE